jgi:putative ABC transport system substrate-binding protein
MKRRDFTIGMLLATVAQTGRAQQSAKQHRIAIVIPAGPVAIISETSGDAVFRRLWQPFFQGLRRLGDVEGQSVTIERYSGEGRPEGFPDLARQVAGRTPDVIVAVTNPVARAIRPAAGTIPIVWIGVEPIGEGLVTSLAHPAGNLTGVSLYDAEFYAKRLQILKEAVPSASKIALLDRAEPGKPLIGWVQRAVREAEQRLAMSVIPMLLEESTPTEYQRVFAQIAQERPDAIWVSDIGDLIPYRRLIVELVEESRLPAMYGYREFVEAGGLMAYEADLGELGRRIADDVHEILNGAKPSDIPIYQSTRFALVINLQAAAALGLTIPPALLGRADEVIE